MKILMIMGVIAIGVHGWPAPQKSYSYNPPKPVIDSYSAPLASVGSLPNNLPTESPDDSSPGSEELIDDSIISSPINHSAPYPPSFIDSSSGDEFSDDIDEDTPRQTIEKNIYVHLPSQETEQLQQKAAVRLPLPRIHYKIIFIKSPTVQNPPPEIPALPQDEERTLIYVLVKKPDEPQDIVITTAKPTEPSKPEVYFIRYKSQSEESNIISGKNDSLEVTTKRPSSGTVSKDSSEDNRTSREYGAPKFTS